MSGDSRGFTDLHSHLVPGVDDGSRTLDESRAAILRLRQAGVRRIVTTPHIDASLTRDKRMLETRLGEMDEAWEAVRAMAEAEFPDLGFHRGHEVMLDIPDPDLSDPRLRLADTSFVLVEWPGLRVPPSSQPVLERLVASGLKPIIAHPDRYRGLDREGYLAGEWRENGAFLQVNYGSLVGRYGDLPRKRAQTFLERGWVDLLASDFHGRAHLSPSLTVARKAMAEWGGGAQFGLLASVNPTRILRGEDPLPVPGLVLNPSFWERIRGVFQTRERW
jgi:protein-tyrosine phosphatase